MAKPKDTLQNPLDTAKRSFREWRENRATRKQRIPDELWNLAVKAGSRHGVNKTARILGLNYSALKRRMKMGSRTCSPATTEQDPQPTAPNFVELFPKPSPAVSEVHVEFENRGGVRMKDCRRLRRPICGSRSSLSVENGRGMQRGFYHSSGWEQVLDRAPAVQKRRPGVGEAGIRGWNQRSPNRCRLPTRTRVNPAARAAASASSAWRRVVVPRSWK